MLIKNLGNLFSNKYNISNKSTKKLLRINFFDAEMIAIITMKTYLGFSFKLHPPFV